MKMEEEAIGWNLRGPKRMRKRKELNALVKNQARYQHVFNKTSSIDMFNMNSGTSRLLSKSNDSSSDNDDYYFAANKLIIREKKRKNCCKLIQMTVIGFVVTFVLIIGLTLIFSYSKFHEALKDLKQEFQSQKEQNQLSINEVKQKLSQYDALFKKDLKDSGNTVTKSFRTKRSAFLVNKLFENLYNNSSSDLDDSQETKGLLKLILADYMKQNISDIDSTNYKNLVNTFLSHKSRLSNAQDQNLFKDELLNNIELLYIKPIIESLEKCNCPSTAIRFFNQSIPVV